MYRNRGTKVTGDRVPQVLRIQISICLKGLINILEEIDMIVVFISFIAVSFYGNSFIRQPFKDASSNSNIKIQFKTQHPHGLILLAAGRTDYLIIQLVDGDINVELELGSGRTVLVSRQPPGVRFDDNNWHFLWIQRLDADVLLTIDGEYTTTRKAPGQFFELNVLHGIFLGGLGTFERELQLGRTFQYFRGCLRYALFNSVNLFYAARQQQNPLNVHHISWECSGEFSATSDQPFSFLSDKSFVAFPTMDMPEGGQFFFELKTRSDRGVIVYNHGKKDERDFLALELYDGMLKLSIDKGRGAQELMSDLHVNDGIWHRITVMVRNYALEVNIDGINKVLRADFNGAEFLDLGGHMFMGGLSSKARLHGIRNRLSSVRGRATGSITGCVRNLRYNDFALVGLKEALITQDVRPNCAWKYPCISNPCVSGAECVEKGYNSYDCRCDQDMCFRPETPKKPATEIVHVTPLYVNESGRTSITTTHVNFVFQYWLYNIDESAIVFRIVLTPVHGVVEVDVPRRPDPNVFTLSDLNANKVHYSHDGSETLSDSFQFTVEILGQKLFAEKPFFTLAIAIMPKNDRPVIELVKDSTLTVILFTKQPITPEIINVFDGDDNPRNLKLLIEYEGSTNGGYFEKLSRSGSAVSSFTQEEIIRQQIVYTNLGSRQQRVRLRVSDGEITSEEKTLTIIGTNLEITPVKNTGLSSYEPGSATAIDAANLAFTTNIPNRKIDLKYHITKAPRFGEIQIRKYAEENTWERADSFAQRHLKNGKIRYLQTDLYTHPKMDEFRFYVRGMSTSSEEYVFRIEYLHGGIRILHNNKLQIHGVIEVKLTNDHLTAQTVDNADADLILYQIITPPRYGRLYLAKNPSASIENQEDFLRANSQFTQRDIDRDIVIYRLSQVSYYAFDDDMRIKIVGPNDVESDVITFYFAYEPDHKNTTFVNNGLRNVLEGRRGRITHEELYVESSDGRNYQFSLETSPQHGVIEHIDPRTNRILNPNASSFTNRDIRDGAIFYHHDNSESEDDSFDFIATAMLVRGESQQEVTEFMDTFRIKITLRNDNAPIRVVDRVFQVVTNQGRVITNKDINFKDPDINFDAAKLQYNIHRIANGRIVLAKNHSARINHFTQQDLETGKLYFSHSGVSYSRTEISVTDTEFYTQAIFEVRASPPFIHLANNTGIMVEKGKYAVISALNLSIETNLDAIDHRVFFVVSKLPRYGQLIKVNEFVRQFTMADVRRGDILYEHNPRGLMNDSFDFDVRIGSVAVTKTMKVKVYTENFVHPPTIVHNKVLVVREGDVTKLRPDILTVTHKDTPPENIVYKITVQPSYGNLYLQPRAGNIDSKVIKRIMAFTQEDIDSGLLVYAQRVPDETTDQFTFDVTNGIKVLQGIDFVFEIIPKTILVTVGNTSVTEGGTLRLSSRAIRVEDALVADELITYVVIRAPLHGWIEDAKTPNEMITRFTSSQLEKKQIQYTHDNNETLSDHFTIVAISRSLHKQSYPYTVYVDVLPVNDEYPEIVVNDQLKIWTGSTMILTRHHLLTVDKDTGPSKLTYEVHKSTIRGGYIALNTSPERRVFKFTQAQIDEGQVAFVHDGSEKRGGFQFHVTDGVNSGNRHRFSIVSRQLQLILKKNKQLEVFPTMKQTITKGHLLAKTNDANQTNEIIFTLQSKPEFGQILRDQQPTETFRQDEIDAGIIQYWHTEPSTSWEIIDSFMFEISTEYANSVNHIQFNIHISYESLNSENQAHLIGTSKLVIPEGGNATLTRDNLNITKLLDQLHESGRRNAYVCYVIKDPPKHGDLMFDGHEVSVGTVFLQEDINLGRMLYVHDDSDTLNDTFEYIVHVGAREESHLAKEKLKTHDGTAFAIEILPVDDQPLILVTQTPTLKIIQGQSAIITKEILEVRDEDSSPAEISYTILNRPNVGHLVYVDYPDTHIRQFTQKDINNNRVVFVHNGLSYKPKGNMYFRVSVNDVMPIFKMFDFKIEMLRLEVKTSNLVITQGQSAVLITPDNIHTVTNDKRENIKFNVTKLPKFGKLFIHDDPVHQFSQPDVDKHALLYVQTDLTASSDSLVLTVYNQRFSLENKFMNITVRPLLKMNAMNASYGRSLPITTDVLDASELAKLTGSDPTYELLKLPRLGRIVRSRKRVVRDANSNDFDAIKSFTHRDVVNNVIFYETKPLSNMAAKQDKFAFKIDAEFAQPAIEMLVINVSPPPDEPNLTKAVSISTTTPPSPSAVEPTDIKEVKGFGIGHDQLLIIFLVVGLVLIAAVILILVKCIHKPRKKRVQDNKKVAPQTGFEQPNSLESSQVGSRAGTLTLPPPAYNNRDVPRIRVTHDPPSLSSDPSPYSVTPQRSRTPSEVTGYGDTIRKAPVRVTPLYDMEETQVKTPIGHGSIRSNRSPTDHVTFEWEACDPDLLQHVRTTNPVLKDSKYWV
ncbi:chondroitin sulfate proteoglycan 4-like [Tubulanus polymorphus]|uniref:chondroitin sulfate proteoglycan 4-like n=1 Tax=Tubulanus polymorphus TaxID=672921 RepID=UPI003DA655A4